MKEKEKQIFSGRLKKRKNCAYITFRTQLTLQDLLDYWDHWSLKLKKKKSTIQWHLGQTPSAEEEHVTHQKAPEQLQYLWTWWDCFSRPIVTLRAAVLCSTRRGLNSTNEVKTVNWVTVLLSGFLIRGSFPFSGGARAGRVLTDGRN